MENPHWLDDDESETEEEAAEPKSNRRTEVAAESANNSAESKASVLLRRLIGGESNSRREARDDVEEANEAEEVDRPADELDSEEESMVTRGLVEAAQLDEERASTPIDDPAEAAAANAVKYFRARILDADTPGEALADTLEVISSDMPDGAASVPSESASESRFAGPGHESATADQPIIHSEQVPVPNLSGAEESWANVSDPTQGRRPGAGGAGGSSTPPAGPNSPSFGGDFWPNTSPAMAAGGSGAKVEYTPDYDEPNAASTALIGGIIGYLIGRRRGRIKTEKRLIPIQKKLEKRVENLKQDLAVKETVIRRAAIERSYEQGVHDKLAIRFKALNEAPSQPWSKSEARDFGGSRGGGRQIETERGQSKPLPLEQLGQALIVASEVGRPRSGNAGHSPAVEAVPDHIRGNPRIDKAEPLAINRRAETLSHEDLLELSSKIMLDGSSLRQTYESHLIGEKGLRRLVAEHLSGGDVRKELRREIVEREIDFERDPILRDQGHQKNGSDGGKALRQMLQQAGVNADEDGDGAQGREALAIFEAKAAHDAKQEARQRRTQHTADATLVTVIVILLAVVVYIFVKHHSQG